MKAALVEPEIVTKNGKPVSVILPIKQYREMMERLEDAEDVAWLKKARRKFEEVLAALAKRYKLCRAHELAVVTCMAEAEAIPASLLSTTRAES